jgi:hypothetical protein
MSSAVARAPRPGLFQVIDWRLVAAIGLPIWAFLLGIVVVHRAAPPAPAPTEPVEIAAISAPTPPVPLETAPAPREVVVRTEYQPVPILVPVPTPAQPVAALAEAPAAPVEFKLPLSEVVPADRCQTFDTKIRFHPDLASAVEEVKSSRKMLFVLHLSGNLDDPGFT